MRQTTIGVREGPLRTKDLWPSFSSKCLGTQVSELSANASQSTVTSGSLCRSSPCHTLVRHLPVLLPSSLRPVFRRPRRTGPTLGLTSAPEETRHGGDGEEGEGYDVDEGGEGPGTVSVRGEPLGIAVTDQGSNNVLTK